MAKKKTKVVAKELAPNDPHRVPLAHRELVVTIFNLIRDAGFDIFEAQVITQAVSLLFRSPNPKAADEVVSKITAAVINTKDASIHCEAILQLLGMKMNEAFNKMKLSDINLSEEA